MLAEPLKIKKREFLARVFYYLLMNWNLCYFAEVASPEAGVVSPEVTEESPDV